jgi:hypothetical protein
VLGVLEERGAIVNRATGNRKVLNFEYVCPYCKKRMKYIWNTDVQVLDASV